MKKSIPINPGENNAFRNADKDRDIAGSVPKADFFNGVEQEILNAIIKAGDEPEDRNNQLGEAIEKIAAIATEDLSRRIIDLMNNHIDNKVNPHNVTKAQLGLGNVNNTTDAAKPISTATQNALNGKLTRPQTAAGIGQVTLVQPQAKTTNATLTYILPSGGTWFYFCSAWSTYGKNQGQFMESLVGVAAGGTKINRRGNFAEDLGTDPQHGQCMRLIVWRIA